MNKLIKKIQIGSLIGLICLLVLGPGYLVKASEVEDTSGYTKIYNVDDLLSISDDPYGKYILMSDISLKDIDWYPINFYGTFDGNGYTVYDLNSTQVNLETNITVDGNAKKYDTYFSGLFGQVINAKIMNLNIKACNIKIDSDGKNSFAACLAGYMENTEITNCSTQGYVYLYAENIMCGVSGLVGFGYGTITGCNTDVTLVYVDGNSPNVKCEQFLGGILATGYADIDGCNVNIKGYVSIHGYAHSGGLVGMYYVHTTDTTHAGYVRNSSVNGFVSFFENNSNRRAYCSAFVGEKLNGLVSIAGNIDNTFTRDERFEYDTILLPNPCENPQYTEDILSPTGTQMGYSTYQCKTCDYSYIANYTFPVPSIEKFQTSLNLNFMSKYNLAAEINSEAQVIWSSSKEEVVKVDQTGRLSANGLGEAIITCSLEDGTVLGECNVTVELALWHWIAIAILIILVIVLIIYFYIMYFKSR